MAVKTKDELLQQINSIEGLNEDTSISLIEDITDTFDSFSDATDWKAKYEENDAAWKKKYKDRFFSNASSEPEEFEPEEPKSYTFESLFKTN